MGALNSRQWLTTRGGALFKAAFTGKGFHLSVLPILVEGERTHHYDILLDKGCTFILIGSINTRGEFRILIKPSSQPLSEAEQEGYRKSYQALGAFLKKHGLKSRAPLDDISKQVIRETALFDPVPEDLISVE